MTFEIKGQEIDLLVVLMATIFVADIGLAAYCVHLVKQIWKGRKPQ